jgi:hypothetical protein
VKEKENHLFCDKTKTHLEKITTSERIEMAIGTTALYT